MTTPPSPSDSKPNSGVNTNIARKPRNFLGELFKKHVETEKKVQKQKKYKGIVLYNKVLTTNQFTEMFDDDFVAYVLMVGKVSGTDLKNISHVDETIVYIPEVSGCLPFPDMTVVEEKIEQLRAELKKEPDEDFKKLSTKAKKREWSDFAKALQRLDRFPRFYSAHQARNSSFNRASVGRNQVVMVEFLDDNDWSGSGMLLGSGH
jgi:hypothetical protein